MNCSSVSRTASKSSRRRLARQSRRLPGSFWAYCGLVSLLCWYALESMTSLCICLKRPAVVHELRREVVQQLRMARRLGLHAQVVRRADEALAEVVHPEAVDRHAGGQRVVAAGDRLGQLQPAAPLGEGLAVRPGEDLQEPPGDDRPAVLRLAADEDVRVARVRRRPRPPSPAPGAPGCVSSSSLISANVNFPYAPWFTTGSRGASARSVSVSSAPAGTIFAGTLNSSTRSRSKPVDFLPLRVRGRRRGTPSPARRSTRTACRRRPSRPSGRAARPATAP